MAKLADRILYGPERPDGGTPYWTMHTIWAAAKGKPELSIVINELNLLDAVVWFGGLKISNPQSEGLPNAHEISSMPISTARLS
jgi:hypothetical protein